MDEDSSDKIRDLVNEVMSDSQVSKAAQQVATRSLATTISSFWLQCAEDGCPDWVALDLANTLLGHFMYNAVGRDKGDGCCGNG
ncbi:hypothetical protein [Hoyosella altamirensis]|uniref:Putative Zn-dependent peptidase n=1 Tax=Hoyosella altamirensis TaxID=616997 RepID=A0A839RV57_9ACTN|nr:hypothetical protein [Hoyosella altamirensis]MBB3040136.1 putative Zn-dependent peptidase [Hoyosella altamirensis]